MDNSIYHFEDLDLKSWKPTLDKIQAYAQLLSDIKSKFTPHQKNWEEFSLKVYAKGLTTTPIPVEIKDGVEALDLNLNFVEHKLKIFLGRERLSKDLDKHTIKSFSLELAKTLNEFGVSYELPPEKFEDESNHSYKLTNVETYWNILRQIYFIMLHFKGELLEETSNINFWPHHMDLALLVFSGRIIPGKDTSDWDNSREQMNFGFSPGDTGITEPYFYITAFPFPDGVLKKSLPGNSYWQHEGWKGAVMKYSSLIEDDFPGKSLLGFFSFVKIVIDEARKF